MTEHYSEFDTKEILIPKNLSPAEHRSTFQPLPPEAPAPPPFSREADEARREAAKKLPSVFEPIDDGDRRSPRRYDSLERGDVLKIPVPVYGSDGKKIPGTYRHETQRVVGVVSTKEGYDAIIHNDAGLKNSLPADTLTDEYNIEARIAEQLIKRDGVDIHSPQVKLMTEDFDKGVYSEGEEHD